MTPKLQNCFILATIIGVFISFGYIFVYKNVNQNLVFAPGTSLVFNKDTKDPLLSLAFNNFSDIRTWQPGWPNTNFSYIAKINHHLTAPIVSQKFLLLKKSCSGIDRPYFFKLLKHWISFAANNSIIWWLDGGTLIGAQRHEDLVPFDSDMDLAFLATPTARVNMWNKQTLRPINKSISQINMVHRYSSVHCRHSSKRMNCNGDIVTSLTDICSFCGPTLRVYLPGRAQIDLYGADVMTEVPNEKDINALPKNGTNGQPSVYNKFIYHEMFDEHGYHHVIPREWIFPLKECNLMGLKVPCPANSFQYSNLQFPNFVIPSNICKNGKWVKNV